MFSTKSREEGLAPKARIRDDADAIMDRIVHNTICVDTGTHNMLEHATMSQQRNSPAGVDGPHHDDRWPPQAIYIPGPQPQDRVAFPPTNTHAR
uniref:hypothetical protein n=1 Tax=Corynebacterium glutamicum TaxID=1718 RepID=UPI0021B11804|nr:hypothetical protein [Corynebacterium glutamicum]